MYPNNYVNRIIYFDLAQFISYLQLRVSIYMCVYTYIHAQIYIYMYVYLYISLSMYPFVQFNQSEMKYLFQSFSLVSSIVNTNCDEFNEIHARK